MERYEFDAVIIGSGCAGYNCADRLYDLGYRNIAILTEGKNMGTSRNTGSDKQTYYKLSLAGDVGDSVGAMAKTLFEGGAMDGDVALAEAANSAACFMKLAGLGVAFPTNEYGEYVGYKTDHDPCGRATSIGPYTSKRMTEVLEAAVEKKNIRVFDGMQAVRILTENGRAVGVLALDTAKTQKATFAAFSAPHVILATGGPAALYENSVYPPSQTGNSSLALEAGAAFGNLSEWQYGLASTDFRWNVSGTYQQVLPRYISIDENGVEREFLTDHFKDPQKALDRVFLKGYEWPFDVRKIRGSSLIDLLVYRESVVLRRAVYLDFTREPTGLGPDLSGVGQIAYDYLKNSNALVSRPVERLNRMNPGAIALYAEHGIDLWKEPLRIAVCAQHNNGGVRIDADWQTTVKGFYAIGEAAGSLGIFRPGGSALNSCQVGGLRAAQHIVCQSQAKPSPAFDALAQKAEQEAQGLLDATHGEHSTLIGTREKYAKRMSAHFAFLRDIPAMKRALNDIAADEAAFVDENRWHEVCDVPHLFKNLDVIRMSRAVGAAMLYTAEAFGSRGSAFVLCGGDFTDLAPLPENEAGRGQIVTVQKTEGDLSVATVPVRPIPARELWFEKAWAEFRARTHVE